MYSRSFYPEAQDRPMPPENYDGTAFMERGEEKDQIMTDTMADTGEMPQREAVQTSGGASSLSIPILSGLFDKGGLLGGLGLSMPRIGTEEILILATAAFLFFSKRGDREIALILLLLLFIN